ncbi:MAG TPA: 3-deoxy-7-phosphoheptulonate synthase [Phycisphaerae bacterium]|nr:3-deoxy-7-phosphoheptulonate synthase [Phycisphaerae bacterium]
MIVVMKPDATDDQVAHMIQRVRDIGLEPHVIHGTERTVVACVGDERLKAPEQLAIAPGVEKVMPVLARYKIASREVKREPTVIDLGPGSLGGTALGVMAGPCAVEDREMLLETAHAVKEAGAIALRGGAFKPRTDPYSFQGLGEKGLEYLAEAREATGLAVVTEVMAPEQVPLVARYADVLQVGARNMQNFVLLAAVGACGKPVLLKRGMSAGLEEFLLAAEYILSRDNERVILCERGIRTFETFTRNTFAVAAVPALKALTHLPVIADPSHGTGRADLVEAVSRAAVAAGADGLIVEVHPDPETALVDGQQSITPEAFARLVESCRKVAQAIGRSL